MKKALFAAALAAGLAGFSMQSHATITCFPGSPIVSAVECGGMGSYCIDSSQPGPGITVNGVTYTGGGICVGFSVPAAVPGGPDFPVVTGPAVSLDKLTPGQKKLFYIKRPSLK